MPYFELSDIRKMFFRRYGQPKVYYYAWASQVRILEQEGIFNLNCNPQLIGFLGIGDKLCGVYTLKLRKNFPSNLRRYWANDLAEKKKRIFVLDTWTTLFKNRKKLWMKSPCNCIRGWRRSATKISSYAKRWKMCAEVYFSFVIKVKDAR